MAFMVMKLKSGTKTYALKIPEDDFLSIKKDPSLLAEYWDQVLEDEKGQHEDKPQVGKPAKRRSKSVGAEARKRKREVPDGEKTAKNWTSPEERKKDKQKDYGDEEVGKHLSVFNEEECLEPEKEPSSVCEEVGKHSSTEGTQNESCVKDETVLKQPIKSYRNRGSRKCRKGVDFQSLDEQVEPSETPVHEESIQVHNSNKTGLACSTKNTSPVVSETVKDTRATISDKGNLPDQHVTQLDAFPKRRRKRKNHATAIVDQEADSISVSKDISNDDVPCLPHKKSNDKKVHEDIQENRSPPNVFCRRSARQQQRQYKQDENCFVISPSRGSALPPIETCVSDSSKSGEINAESQGKMSFKNLPQKISSVGSSHPCIPQSIKLVASPVKTLSNISQTLPVLCASESSKVAAEHILQTPFPQRDAVTAVQVQNFTPFSTSTPCVTIIPGPQLAPTTNVAQPPTAASTVPLSTVVQGTLQQGATQNPESVTVNSLPLTSVMITPIHCSATPNVVSQSTLFPVLPNLTQVVPSPHIPFGNNCQLVQCLQTPCLAQNVVVPCAVSNTVVTPKSENVLEQSPAQSSSQVTSPKKVVKMTLREVSAAIKKSPQKTAAVFHPIKNEPLHNLETSPQKISPVKSLSITASHGSSCHTLSPSRKQDPGTSVTSTHPVQRRGHPPLLKSLPSVQSKSTDHVCASERKSCEVEQSDVSKVSKVELKSPQRQEVKTGEGILGAATSTVAIRKRKFPPCDLSGVNTPKGEHGSQLNQNTLLLGDTKISSVGNLKGSIKKKIPLKHISNSENRGKRVKLSENVVQKGISEDAALCDKVSILLVPVSMPATSSCSSGSASQNVVEKNVTQKLLSTSTAKKHNLVETESCAVDLKLRKRNKVSITKGEKEDMPLEVSHCAGVLSHSPPKSRYAAPSEKCIPTDLSQTLDFKIVHPLTPVQPAISYVPKKVISTEASGTSKDNSGVVSPNKVPKRTRNKKNIPPKIGRPQSEINKVPVVHATGGTVLDSIHLVPNVSTSESSHPDNAVHSKATELQHPTQSPPGLKAFETLLNEGLDSITRILEEKAMACEGRWDTDVCFSFLSECLKEKDTFFNPSAEDLNFETVCHSLNQCFPKLNATVSDCDERWWEFVILFEILTKKLLCHQLNECLLIPEERRKGIIMICQAMAYRKYPLSHKNLQEKNKNDRVNAALKFLNDSLDVEMDRTQACSVKRSRSKISPHSVCQASDTRQMGFVDLFMLLTIKIQQFMQSTEFFADCIDETLTTLAQGHCTP